MRVLVSGKKGTEKTVQVDRGIAGEVKERKFSIPKLIREWRNFSTPSKVEDN